MTTFSIFLVLVIVIGMIGQRYWSRRQRLRGLFSTPLPQDARAIIAAQVPLTRKLPPDIRARFEGKVNAFLDQVDFIGCNGLEVSEEMRLSIAAQACLLIANTDTWYRHLTTILIYPGAFKSRQARQHGFVVTEREIIRTGESWSRGPVVLSWAHTQHGALDDTDGHNVVLHEFAHQIDDLSGNTDGVPNLDPAQSYAAWERAFLPAYKAHVRKVSGGERTVLDPYGAEGHEEFFAVAVEAFFETPAALKQGEPEIYEQLSMLFRLDPVTWPPD